MSIMLLSLFSRVGSFGKCQFTTSVYKCSISLKHLNYKIFPTINPLAIEIPRVIPKAAIYIAA